MYIVAHREKRSKMNNNDKTKIKCYKKAFDDNSDF